MSPAETDRFLEALEAELERALVEAQLRPSGSNGPSKAEDRMALQHLVQVALHLAGERGSRHLVRSLELALEELEEPSKRAPPDGARSGSPHRA